MSTSDDLTKANMTARNALRAALYEHAIVMARYEYIVSISPVELKDAVLSYKLALAIAVLAVSIARHCHYELAIATTPESKEVAADAADAADAAAATAVSQAAAAKIIRDLILKNGNTSAVVNSASDAEISAEFTKTIATATAVSIAAIVDENATKAEHVFSARTKAVFDDVIAKSVEGDTSPEDAAKRARELYTEQAVGSRARAVMHNSKSSATAVVT